MKIKVLALTPLAWACKCALAQSLPTGGNIVQGNGVIATQGNTMLVQQASDRMITDWQSFSIASGNTVRFVQPSADSMALNRVIGSDPSQILGALSANGRVYLQNPNGVLFAVGAQVNVGSLVATTLEADPMQFMDGRLQLNGSSTGVVQNDGTINVTQGGHAVLAGRTVVNHGAIDAPGGTVALVAGSQVAIDPTGAGVVSISVPTAALDSQVENYGTLTADGGRIDLQAAALNAASRVVLQVGGVVRARSIGQVNGEIVLSSAASGAIAVGGTLDASGGGGAGGDISVAGQRVLVRDTAQLDATGSGGGRVQIGDGAFVTIVQAGANIDVSAQGEGNGGEVLARSGEATLYYGGISARGGANGGNGGTVHISSDQLASFDGSVDTSAASGNSGTLLFDPMFINVGVRGDLVPIPAVPDELTFPNTRLLASSGFTSVITAARVASLLDTTNVTLRGSQVDINAPLTVPPGRHSNTLTLNGYLNTINAPMVLNNSALVIDTLSGGSDLIRVNAPTSSLRSVAMTSTTIELAGDVRSPSLALQNPEDSGPTSISQFAGVIAADTVSVDAVNGLVSLRYPDVDNYMGQLDVRAADAIVSVGHTPAAAPLAISGTVSGNYSLQVGAGLVQSGPLVIGGLFTLASGDALLDNAANDFATVHFDTSGALRLRDANDLRMAGLAAGPVAVRADGLFTLVDDMSTSSPSLMEINSAGFDNSADARLEVPEGGRFIIRSSDFTRDHIGAIGFSATGIANVNSTVLEGWPGADPATGNVYYTNRTGTIDTPNSDRPPVSRAYDRTTGFDFNQTGESAHAALVGATTNAALGHYTVVTSGDFANPRADVDKSYTVAATNNVVATMAGDGSTLFGLRYESFMHPSGPVGPGTLGNAISEVTPLAVVATGVAGTDRSYDGTTTVALNFDHLVWSGVLPGDDAVVSAAGTVGTMADEHIGAAKPVTADGVLTLTGTDSGNYRLFDQSRPTVAITAPVVQMPPIVDPAPVNTDPAPSVADPLPDVADPVPRIADPQESLREGLQGVRPVPPPGLVALPVGSLAPPSSSLKLAAAAPVCAPSFEWVTDTMTRMLYFDYRSDIVDESRSAEEYRSLAAALAEGFQVRRVRGFASPEGLRSARYGFEGNESLSGRRARAALERLRQACDANGSDCLTGSIEIEAGGELYSMFEAGEHGQSREIEGVRLAEHAVSAFSLEETEPARLTPDMQRQLAEASSPAEKAAIVYPRLRRAEIDLERRRRIDGRPAASGCVVHSGDADARGASLP
ncbi:MAG: filamentous hemagglutinin N-terminal domain-containing protein [Gammaproteobacteria bacterium]